MITVKLGNRTLGITFQRELIPASAANPSHVRATWCELHRLAPPVTGANGKITHMTEAIVARAYARCAKRDNFNLEAGRKLALTRALKSYGLTRDQRGLVWSAYLDRPRPTSKPRAQAPVKVQPVEDAILTILEGSPSSVRSQVHLDLNAGERH